MREERKERINNQVGEILKNLIREGKIKVEEFTAAYISAYITILENEREADLSMLENIFNLMIELLQDTKEMNKEKIATLKYIAESGKKEIGKIRKERG